MYTLNVCLVLLFSFVLTIYVSLTLSVCQRACLCVCVFDSAVFSSFFFFFSGRRNTDGIVNDKAAP